MHEKLRSAAAGSDKVITRIRGGNAPSPEEFGKIPQARWRGEVEGQWTVAERRGLVALSKGISSRLFAPSAEELARIRELIAGWREEVKDQWAPAARRGPDAERMASLFSEWTEYGEDPRELLFLILGCEWLYRARTATKEDISHELLKVQLGLTKGWGQTDSYLVPMVVDALAPALGRRLKKLRYLVSLRRPAAFSIGAMELSSIIKHGAPDSVPQSRPLVHVRSGAVQKLSPIVSSIVAAHRLTTKGQAGIAFGLRLATALAGRTVTWSEVDNWSLRAAGPEGANAGNPEEIEALSLAGLAERWRRYFRHGGIQPAWLHLTFGECLDRAELSGDLQAFWHTGHDFRCIEWLYSLRFSDTPRRRRGSRGVAKPGQHADIS